MMHIATFLIILVANYAFTAAAANDMQECDTIAGTKCKNGYFCNHPVNSCNVPHPGGKCVRIPEACIEIYQPVCGCDGKTYSNDCKRKMAQAQKHHDRECNSTPTSK